MEGLLCATRHVKNNLIFTISRRVKTLLLYIKGTKILTG